MSTPHPAPARTDDLKRWHKEIAQAQRLQQQVCLPAWARELEKEARRQVRELMTHRGRG